MCGHACLYFSVRLFGVSCDSVRISILSKWERVTLKIDLKDLIKLLERWQATRYFSAAQCLSLLMLPLCCCCCPVPIFFFTTIKVLFPLFKCYPKFLSQLHSSPPGFLVVCNMCVCATFVLILIKEGHWDLCLFCLFLLSLPCRLALIVSNSPGDLRQMRQHSKGNYNVLCRVCVCACLCLCV